MGDDSLEMIVQQSSEPEQVLVAGSHAHVHDFCDGAGHGWLIGHLVGLTEFLLDQVQGEQELVLPDKVLTAFKLTGFPYHRLGSFPLPEAFSVHPCGFHLPL